MTDLYIVLISLAALIIIAVLIINWWQERKYRLEVERGFANNQADPFLNQDAISEHDATDIEDDLLHYRSTKTNARLDTNPSFEHVKVNDFSQTHQPMSTLDEDITNELAALDALAEQKTLHAKAPAQQERIEPQFGEISDTDEIATAMDTPYAAHPSDASLVKAHTIDEKAVTEAVKPTTAAVDVSVQTEIKSIFEEAFNAENAPVDSHLAASADNEHSPMESIAHDLKVTLPNALHGQMDLIGLLYLAENTPIQAIKATLTGLLNAYDKPSFVHVLANDQWVNLVELEAGLIGTDTLVSRVTCSLQLADRNGAISRTSLNRFQLDVESAGLAINAHVAWQSAGDALNTAVALDAFCAEVDQSVRFHLRHGENGAFTGTKLRGLAEAQGFSIANDGTFKFIDAQSNRVHFIMYNQENHPFSPEMLRTSVVKSITFELDLPHVKNCAEVFSQMVQVARQMEIGLHAVLVDDNLKALSEVQIEKIRQHLKVIHAKMLVKGIAPGSDEADRLFS